MDLIEELQDDIQQERHMRFVRYYGPKIVTIALLLVVIVAGSQFYKQHQAQNHEMVGDQLYRGIEALQSGREDAAFEELDVLMKDGVESSPATLAALIKAGYWMQNGEPGKAATLYEQVKNSSKDPVFREFGQMMHLYTMVYFYDQGKRSDVVFPEGKQPAPWGEMITWLEGLYAIDKGDNETARQAFSSLIGDETSSSIMRQSATRFMSMIEGQNAH